MPAPLVVSGAQLMCTMGSGPAKLTVLPTGQVQACGQPVACINDNKPMVNVPAFAMCKSLANPTVAAATSAAQGALTPQPCVPVIPAPWVPGVPLALAGGPPAVNATCKLTCAWAGIISVQSPGQSTVLG